MADKAPGSVPPKPKVEPHHESHLGDMQLILEKTSFFQEFKDLLFPKKQAELVLESKPVAVKDIWSPPKSVRSRMSSILVHLGVIGILLLPFWKPVQQTVKKVIEVPIFVPPTTPPPPPPKIHQMASGGSPSPTQAPKVIMPQVHILTAPTSLVPLSEVMSMPSFGTGMVVGSAPAGYGGGSGGGGGGCTGPNCGTGPGGDATVAPEPIYAPDPDYSDAARKAKFQGTCRVEITVGVDGRVSNPKVIEALGLGLDEKAIEAVKQWKFKPARDKDGHPVAVVVQVDVEFHLY